MKKLHAKNILITGGTSGIGLATARLFKNEGARLLVTGRDNDRIEATQRELGNEALVVQSEAGNLSNIEDLYAKTTKYFNTLDVLFLNAAVAKPAPFDSVTEAQFDETFVINLKGIFFTIQKFIPLLSKGSSIIVTTSITNQMGSPGFSVYGASKAALRSLVQSLGLELISKGIRINAISPGPINTPMFERFGLPLEVSEAIKTQINAKSPIKRFGEAEEIAKVALFLASEDSSYIVGEEIVVDGGMSLL
ncbi:MAG: SDR family oxidoreductase [Pseudomonadota bacterium]